MQKIRILSVQEIQSIAAGEVIESTHSIIKELTENSLDAGASRIIITIKNGGMDYISVLDDGCGLSVEDLSLALLPHATSKLKNITDLQSEDNLFYGFRGEALAAIAGVSRLKITTREQTEKMGFSIESNQGILSEINSTAINFGTHIEIFDLFADIPVRKKYLPGVSTQEKNIMHTAIGISLANPQVHLSIWKENKLWLDFQARDNFIEKVGDIASQKIDHFVLIKHKDEYCKIEGIISGIEYGQYDRSKMFILANNRLIKQYKISQSCIKAYQSDQFSKRYPELYLTIKVPADQININIHPRKEEVAFLYQKKIEQIITSVISQALEERTKILLSNIVFEETEPKKTDCKTESIQIKFPNEIIDSKKNTDTMRGTNTTYDSKLANNKNNNSYSNNTNFSNKSFLPQNQHKDKNKIIDYYPQNINSNFQKNNEEKAEYTEEKNKIKDLFFDNTKKYIGVLNDTYLLFLTQKSILFIDQHAIHEKILYKKYIQQKCENTFFLHPLLFDECYALSEKEVDLLTKEKSSIEKIGLTYEISDNKITVLSCSNEVKKIGIYESIILFCQLLKDNEHISKKEKTELLLHNHAALFACKNAVKAGQKLSEHEISELIQYAIKTDDVSLCPHGRPIYYEIQSEYLEKVFKRKN